MLLSLCRGQPTAAEVELPNVQLVVQVFTKQLLATYVGGGCGGSRWSLDALRVRYRVAQERNTALTTTKPAADARTSVWVGVAEQWMEVVKTYTWQQLRRFACRLDGARRATR